MKNITIKTPAKINLTLEVLNKRADGFHNIKSIMQTVSLFDYISIAIEEDTQNSITIDGNNKEIPYNENNIIYKAWKLFFEKANLKTHKVKVYIKKNIPVSAGLAGGSTNAAGFLYGLNQLFDNFLSKDELHKMCATLGSDLNFCLEGGCALCTSRGEKIQKLPFVEQKVTLIKPKNLGISAKEAYIRFSQMSEQDKAVPNNTEKLIELLNKNSFDEKLLFNSLEKPLLDVYSELSTIKKTFKNSLMSGSGSTFFVIGDYDNTLLVDRNDFIVVPDLKFVPLGVASAQD